MRTSLDHWANLVGIEICYCGLLRSNTPFLSVRDRVMRAFGDMQRMIHVKTLGSLDVRQRDGLAATAVLKHPKRVAVGIPSW